MRKRSAKRTRRTKKVHQNETAKITETYVAEAITANAAYEAVTDLSQFSRALDIADNFQLYRITNIKFKYTPKFDTFVPSGAASPTLPYLYTKRLTYPAPATFGLPFLTAMGAKPRRLDDKNLTVSYTPNINMFGSSFDIATTPVSQVNALKPSFKPWLNTHQQNPLTPTALVMDNTPHYGHVTFIDQTIGGLENTPVCSLEVTATFEFKKPWDLASQTVPEGTPAVRRFKKR
jgi:hypothetical protein